MIASSSKGKFPKQTLAAASQHLKGRSTNVLIASIAVLASSTVSANITQTNAANVTTQQENKAQTPSLSFNASMTLDFSKSESSNDFNENLQELSIRRLRAGVDLELSKAFSASVSTDVDTENSELSLQSAWLKFKQSKKRQFKIGLMKQPFGLEKTMSSSSLRTPERAMATDALSPDSGIGVAWAEKGKKTYFSVGLYANEEETNLMNLASRFVWTPLQRKRALVHFGLGISYRDNDQNSYRVSSDGSLDAGKQLIKSAKYEPDSVTTVGLEAAWMRGPVSLQAEWMLQNLDIETTPDVYFHGGYIQGGYVLNNGRRKYSNGKFGRIAGKNKQSIELSSSVGYLDTRDEQDGESAIEMTLGVNYHVSKYIQLSTHIMHANVEDNSGKLHDRSGIIARAQLSF